MPHLVRLQAEAGHDLLVVGVEPLGRDVQVDTSLAVGDGQSRLGAQRRLVLHARLVVTLHHHRAGGVAVGDVEHPVGLTTILGGGRVGERLEFGVVDDYGLGAAPRRLAVVGGDHRHRLAPEPDLTVGEYRLIGMLEAEEAAPGDVVDGEYGANARDGEGSGGVDPVDARPGVRAAHGGPPEHALGGQVRGEGELASHLWGAVGPRRRCPDAAGDPGRSGDGHEPSRRAVRACMIPP
jgi:hypothetical protein